MASRTFNIVLGTLVVLALGGAWVAVHLDNARLRRQLAAQNGQRGRADRLREDNRQLQEIIARAQADAGDGARAIQADLLRARTQVQELENKARISYAQRHAALEQDAENLTNNRDPEKGLTRLEQFRNQGQATPEAAFQTFVWAAMQGEDATLAALIAMDDTAREKGLAVIAALPEETRAKFPTPEKLAALFFAAALTGQASAQIMDVTPADPQHATVTVRGLTDQAQKIPMQLGPQGWQILVPSGMAERLGDWALGGTLSSARK